MNYILITPVKNESANLPNLIECIVKQTILPKIWVIIDGNSTDGTIEIVSKKSKEFEWIYWKIQKNFSDEGHLNFAWAVKEGYEYALKISIEKSIKYEYIGKVDADIVIPKNYFEKLIEKFEKNPKLGVASGIGYTLKLISGKNGYEDINEKDAQKNIHLVDELPDKRLYRKKCIDDIGGFPIYNAPDTVMIVKSRLKCWETKWFNDVKFYDVRKGSSAQRGLWEGAKMEGYVKYYLGYHPVLIILSIMYRLSREPHYPAIALFYGYVVSGVLKKNRITDQEIINYFGSTRLKEILKHIKKFMIHSEETKKQSEY